MARYLLLLVLLLSACGGGSNPPGPARPAPDTTPPVITLTGDNPQIIVTGDAYIELGATATDNVDGDVSAAIVIDDTGVDTTSAGSYLVTYSVRDSAGNAAATVTRTVNVENPPPPVAPSVSVIAEIKQLDFSWSAVPSATHYKLLENPDGHSGFSQVGDDLSATTLSAVRHITVHFHDFVNALYIVQACSNWGCTNSAEVHAMNGMLDTIGYFKASNTDKTDNFGGSVAISDDGTTMAVGALTEDSGATGINGDQSNNTVTGSGAVYIFRLGTAGWFQQAYIKASNTNEWHWFGVSIALSALGNTLAVGAPGESSSATGINGDQRSDFDHGWDSGAAYVFRFDGSEWSQQAYIKASNTGGFNGFPGEDEHQEGDAFGESIDISADGNTLVVGAPFEDGSASGINGDQFADQESTFSSGAAYIFHYDGTEWSQQAYVKASNPGYEDFFGEDVALSRNGLSLVVGAPKEDSVSVGINGDQSNDPGPDQDTGAAYLFRFDGSTWSQEAYIKATNARAGQYFGSSVSLSADGSTLAAGAKGRDSHYEDPIVSPSSSAYVFRFDGVDWFQQANITASNTRGGDTFGEAVSLSADGNVMAVGAGGEDGAAAGINGDENALGGICDGDPRTMGSGAVYVFRFDGTDWNQQAYVKALEHNGRGSIPKDCRGDNFGGGVALSADGETLAVGASGEDSDAKGIGGDHVNDSALSAGAAFLY